MTTPAVVATHPLRTGALAIVQTQRAYQVITVDAEGQAAKLDDAEFWTFEAAHERMVHEAGRIETRRPVGSFVGTVTNSSWRMARER